MFIAGASVNEVYEWRRSMRLRHSLNMIRQSSSASRSLIVLGLVALLALMLTAPVDASARRGHVSISGDSTPSDCNEGEGDGAIMMSGDLEGCLTFFVDRFECDELNGFARYREWGAESFDGEFRGQEGTFRTTYDLEATYEAGSCADFDAGEFPYLNQLTGGCDHKIVAGDGVFRGVRGHITYFDVIPVPGESGASNFLYAGALTGRTH
jgi:hypothetical protein